MEIIFDNLMALVDTNEAFFYKDIEKGFSNYRIFNYRLASYTDFMEPSALECRGIMFEIDTDSKPVRIASRPMEKFFNLDENPMTIGLDLSKVKRIMEKADGSLISTYVHNDIIYLKSKGSLESQQAIDATKFLHHKDNTALKDIVEHYTNNNFTVNMEWCSPDNRVVLHYDKPHLKILNVRHNVTGEYEHKVFEKAKGHTVYLVSPIDVVEFINNVPDMSESIEGFVCELESGQKFKIKTKGYLALHHSKDSINSPRRLYEVVLNEASDDLKSMFHDDHVALATITAMEEKVDNLYNHIVDSVERFYERNKGLERKDYAVLGQKELDKLVFPLAMNLYIGKGNNYKEWMISKWKSFGIKDKESNYEE